MRATGAEKRSMATSRLCRRAPLRSALARETCIRRLRRCVSCVPQPGRAREPQVSRSERKFRAASRRRAKTIGWASEDDRVGKLRAEHLRLQYGPGGSWMNAVADGETRVRLEDVHLSVHDRPIFRGLTCRFPRGKI